MNISIIECLKAARHNLDLAVHMPVLMPLVKEQLNNAIKLLDKGYCILEEVEPLIEKYGSIEKVPEKDADLFKTNI